MVVTSGDNVDLDEQKELFEVLQIIFDLVRGHTGAHICQFCSLCSMNFKIYFEKKTFEINHKTVYIMTYKYLCAMVINYTNILKVFFLGGWNCEKFCLYILHILQFSVMIIYIFINKTKGLILSLYLNTYRV